MIAGFTKGDKAVKAEKTSDQLRELSVAEYVVKSIHDLQKLHNRLCSSQGNNCVNDREKFVQDSDGLGIFQFLKSYINDAEKNEPSIKNLTIMKFLRSIIEDRELYKKLCSFDDFLDCELENLRDKISLLALLREEMDFTDIQKAYGNWRFSNLIGDNDFKRMYVDEAVKEREKPVNEDFEKNIGKYIELVKEGKEVASRYFGKWKEDFQVYCEEIDNNNKVLNINLTHYDNSEPTKISDVLQQEKDIKELNIYCNKKHEIHAHKKDKKRYYEFKEGAYYEMTSTWAAKDGSGMCTMIMNVSSDGITEILKFNGEDFVSSKEILELIKQNDELYIQDLSLYDAVMESLEENRATPINLYNESMVAYQGKEPEGKLDHKVDADNSLPSSPSINSNALEANLQHTETQPEIASQQIRTQEETNSQRMDELIPDNQISSKENVELKQEMSSLKKGATELKQEIEAETIVKLERHDSDLKDELEEEVKFDIEDPEIEYEEFPEDILELIEDEDSIDELQENYSDIIADQIQTIEEMKEEIENLNNQVKYLEDQQDQVTDKQKISKTISGYAKQYYSLMGEVFSELDNESDVPLKEKTTLHKSPSLDSGLDSDEENCDNDLSSNISSISSVEKVAESRNVGNLLSSCIIWR
ncbi:hypothetical protein L3551_01145 [Wolbachia endosymbiont of Aedes aegypti]|nr:hypothetical protein L3551_01145 [Wolbachia endosymbiont of Aedes aegypti]